ncbi:MAG: response regulator, partial [Bdellovibrionales bacterium]|nr:response regulator [Bdellovibrionales bacterium]
QLSQMQKAEGLGLLAAGVAHNFNNALQGILGHATILSQHSDKPEYIRRAGEAIIEIVTRSSGLASQLIAFDQKRAPRKVLLDLNLIAMSAVNRVQDVFEGGIKVAVSFGTPGMVLAESEPLVEAVEALIRNSAESLKSRVGNVTNLSIKTSQVQIRDLEFPDLRSGLYSRLTVTDSGAGMNNVAQGRCLEPFYTTKERDEVTGVGLQGSGLGLSKALAVIRGFNGTIAIQSAKGVGTAVSIYLPVAQSDKSDRLTSSARFDPTLHPNILVVDDDLMVLNTIESMLKDLGYSPVSAEDGPAALSLLRSYKDSLKLVLLDAIMPGMDGATLMRELKKVHKELRVIGFSGATPEHTRPMTEAGAIAILNKPIGSAELRSAIETALSTHPKLAANN